MTMCWWPRMPGVTQPSETTTLPVRPSRRRRRGHEMSPSLSARSTATAQSGSPVPPIEPEMPIDDTKSKWPSRATPSRSGPKEHSCVLIPSVTTEERNTVLLPTPVVDQIASMRPRTFEPLSPRNRSRSVRRVPDLHRCLKTSRTGVSRHRRRCGPGKIETCPAMTTSR